ncbi:hypothetical protein EST38_g10183 [Candolleomyces aberdarensis]|uniref:Uncharacterized protein n=1 Tax=Candolleomyces aberdarensis TaxID=2316362 RepID=A0A4Q2DAG6_9AGAR|nr:hypothetical protein EST38_g10183 [Candolleomyces aberdarensis]
MISSSPVQLGGEQVERQRYPEDMNDNLNAKTITKTVYHQDDSQGPIYNGAISGGVNAVYERLISIIVSEGEEEHLHKMISGGNSFSGSHNRSTFEKVITAGNDVFMPTLHFHLNTPSLTASHRRTRANQILQQCIQSVSSFFQSPVMRDALIHSLPGETAPAVHVASMPIQLPIEDPLQERNPKSEDDIGDGGNNEDAQPHNSPEKSQHDSGYDVSSMSELDLRSIQWQVTTNAEIYTRSPRGIVPGDVGTFDLTYGFKKIFNLWEDEYAGGWDLPAKEIVRSDHFAEGHTISSGTSSKVRRSEDGKHIQVFELQCNTENGAVLACTTSADVEELDDTIVLRDFLIQHAGVVYQHATSLRRLAEEDSLYIVSGCIKSDGWGLAAYQGAMSGEGLKLSKRSVGDGDSKGVRMYEWTDRGTAEARFGLNSTTEAGQYKGKNHSLFLRGFKLAFSPTFRARMRDLKKTGPDMESFDGGQGKYKSNSTGHGPSSGNQPGSTGSKSNSSSNFSSVNGNTTLSSDVTVDSFPDVSRAVRRWRSLS